MAKKLDVGAAPIVTGSRYPPPFDRPCLERLRLRVGDLGGLTQFGVNVLRLPPGAWSSQRHWHTAEDEFVFVVAGEVVLVTDCGAERLQAGDCAAFKAGVADGHHLQNQSGSEAVLLEIGARRTADDQVFYPDIDLQALKGRAGYAHRNGEPYPGAPPRNP